MAGFSMRAPEGKAPKDVVKDKEPAAHDDHDDHHGPPQMWGKGIISDFKNTVSKHWVEEMTNFNTKTIGVSLFLFIAVIAPSITFGAGRYCASITMTAYRCSLPYISLNVFLLVSFCSLRKAYQQPHRCR